MFKLSKIGSFSALLSIFVIYSSAVYADITGISDANAGQGNGQGNGHGQGQSHGQGKGQGQSHGQNKGQGQGHKNAANSNSSVAKSHGVRFANTDQQTISKYYSANPFPVSTLPPGIAMNLARGKPLPPGIAKQYLPPSLVSQLPVYPGYEYLAVGKDVILRNTTTGIVTDILTNILH